MMRDPGMNGSSAYSPNEGAAMARQSANTIARPQSPRFFIFKALILQKDQAYAAIT